MAKNEFLPFGTAEGANVLSNQEYEALAARHNGFNSGVAKSKELNKVWRQASLIASAVAQFIVDTDQKDLLDTGDVADIKSRLASVINLIISNGDYVTNPYLKLELLKKIDKADIAQQLGNDTTKVPSLHLVATELGKKAGVADVNGKLAKDQNGADIPDKPKFIENLGLPELLNKKFDKTGGIITASGAAVDIRTKSDSSGYFQISDTSGKAMHQIGKTTAGAELIIRNVTEEATVSIGKQGVKFNGSLLGIINTAFNGNNGGGWWRCGTTGVIIQWGRTPVGATSRPINFPIPFTDAGYVVVHFDGGFRDNTRWGTGDRTKTGFVAMCNDPSQGGNYIAIGF